MILKNADKGIYIIQKNSDKTLLKESEKNCCM